MFPRGIFRVQSTRVIPTGAARIVARHSVAGRARSASEHPNHIREDDHNRPPIAVWPRNCWAEGAAAAAALLDQLGAEQCIAVGLRGGAVVALLLILLCHFASR